MKLCKDCKHCRPSLEGRLIPGWGRFDFSECKHPSAIIRSDPVSGYQEHTLCDLNRRWTDRCGPDAKFFEPMPPKRWWEFWK